MVLREAVRRLLHPTRSLALAMLILALTAGTALAAVLVGGNNDNTIVGSPQADNIADGNGNDSIWGQGGGDTITVGNGNDMIDADGHCSGISPGVFPNPLAKGGYCGHGRNNSDPDAHITAGNGNDAVFAGAGNDHITVGIGTDTIYGGPGNDTIVAGDGSSNGATKIYLQNGANNVTVGGGKNNIYAFNATDTTNVDHITCASTASTAYVNRQDVVTGCKKVVGSSPVSAASRSRHHTRRHSTHKSKRSHLTF